MSGVLNVSEMFGKNAFDDMVIRDCLPESVYKKLKKTIKNGAELDSSIVDVVAHAIKDWATERGTTHYTHQSQPLTGVTTEKHDSFISALSDGKVIMESSGGELIKGESDTSSLLSGGLRTIFEVRGYTVWDCTLPAFLWEDVIGVTLCVLTSFYSYKRKTLNRKAPLLRSVRTVNEQALRTLRLFGNTIARRVVPSMGAEQGYSPVDKEKYLQHKDLIYAGRILFDVMPLKGQELEDHHFGAIRERIGSYMNGVSKELWKLGVPAKTQHDRMTPARYELAPIYESVSQAVDHNQIVMETLKRVTGHHDMAYLLHERPFTGVNGSDKHNNWSLTGDDGTNLLNPDDTPHEDIQFLLVLACIIKAADIYIDLLRESASDMGNGHRLGANEAPPTIISISLGGQLEDVIDQLCSTGEATHPKQGGILRTGVDILPDLDKDTTDRNRTSPFAFTGNKFEPRMVGSLDSIAFPSTVLNTIVAEAFKEATDMLEKVGGFDMTAHDFIKETLVAHKRIIFNENGHSDEWVIEAGRGGFPNIRSMVDVIPALTADKVMELSEAFGVFTRAELESRSEVEYENYSKATNIEARTMYDMIGKSTIPAVIKYTTQLASSIVAMEDVCQEADINTQTELLIETSKLLAEIKTALARLLEVTEKATVAEGGRVQTLVYHSQVVPATEALGAPMDQLEMIVDKKLWPMSSYGDLISEV